MEKWSYIFALSSNLCFATASLVYTHYSKKLSVNWMNCFKATLAFVCTTILILILGQSSNLAEIPLMSAALFFLSGVVGLMIGDIFLLQAFTILGPGRSLLLFGFQPVILGISAYFLFQQQIYSKHIFALLCFILCLFVFSLEQKRKQGSWGLSALALALIAVSLDSLGILLTKEAFSIDAKISGFTANFYRNLGAMTGFAVLSFFRPFHFFKTWKDLSKKSKTYISVGSFAGTFLSLNLYLIAVKFGHIASISGIAITSPIIASILERIVNKHKFSNYLFVAFACFAVGISILLFT